MSENVIESYLVSLGWKIDHPQFQQVEVALKKMDQAVDHHLGGMIGSFAKWTSSIVGAFAAVGGATLGMMDKMATADQDFRLFAESMFMSEPAARKLKMATDALGYSLDQIAWDPELSARLNILIADQAKMDALARSPDVATGLRGIRDMQFEFTRMKVEFEEIAAIASGKLFHALGGEGMVERLQRLNDYVQAHIPQIIAWLQKYFVPILHDVEKVGLDVWKVMEALGRAFERLLGTNQIDDQRSGWERFGDAIDKAADYMVKFVDAVTSAVLMVTDLFDILMDILHLDFKALSKDLKALGGDTTASGVGVLGVTGIGTLLGATSLVGLVKLILSVMRAGAGGVLEGAAGELAGGGAAAAGGASLFGPAAVGLAVGIGVEALDKKYGTAIRSHLGLSDDVGENQRRIKRLLGMHVDETASGGSIDDQARRYGVDPALAHAVAHQESGERQYDKKGNLITSRTGAQGMFQIEPWTAKALGVDASDVGQNIEGGVRLLASLMQKYGNSAEALAAYNWGEKHLDNALAKHHGQFSLDYLPAETRQYVTSIERQTGGDVHVGAIHVNVQQPNATPDQIHAAVASGVRDGVNKKTQSNLTNLQGAYS